MNIRWNKVRILVSPLTHGIFLVKGKADEHNPLCFIASDKSADKTEECLAAVVTHLLYKCGADGRAGVEFPGIARLVCVDLTKGDEAKPEEVEACQN